MQTINSESGQLSHNTQCHSHNQTTLKPDRTTQWSTVTIHVRPPHRPLTSRAGLVTGMVAEDRPVTINQLTHNLQYNAHRHRTRATSSGAGVYTYTSTAGLAASRARKPTTEGLTRSGKPKGNTSAAGTTCAQSAEGGFLRCNLYKSTIRASWLVPSSNQTANRRTSGTA